MLGLLRIFILLPIAILFVSLLIANRHLSLIKLDPLNPQNPLLGLELPMYLILAVTLLIGIVIGGFANAFAARKKRAASRQALKDKRELQRETEKLKHHIQTQTKAAVAQSRALK